MSVWSWVGALAGGLALTQAVGLVLVVVFHLDDGNERDSWQRDPFCLYAFTAVTFAVSAMLVFVAIGLYRLAGLVMS